MNKKITITIILIGMFLTSSLTNIGSSYILTNPKDFDDITPKKPIIPTNLNLDQQNTLWDEEIIICNNDGMAVTIAQSFKPTKNLLTNVEVYIMRYIEPSKNINLHIRSDLSGANMASSSKTPSQIPEEYNWINFDFTDITVTPESTYYIVLETSYDAGPGPKGYLWRFQTAGSPYTGGSLWKKSGTGSWTNFNSGQSDATFKTYGETVNSNSPVADFTSDKTSGYSPLNVYFTDQSTNNPTSWSWTFGDETTSTQQNPSHIYNNPGQYTVSLAVTNTDGSDTETKTNYITVLETDKPPVADFHADITTGSSPLTVQFTDDTTNNPIHWDWTFGDGTTSTQQNPCHTYNNIGTYTVSLYVYNNYAGDTETKTNYITVLETDKPPVADFHADITTGSSPLTVQFTDDTTNNPIHWDWTFGDGTTSTQQNPCHTYNNIGTYTVSLNVYNNIAGDSKSKINYITVVDNSPPNIPEKPTGPIIGRVGEELSFTTVTTDPDHDDLLNYFWNWGDGDDKVSGEFNLQNGVPSTCSHSWDTVGVYKIRVRAFDTTNYVFGHWTDYSEPLEIKIISQFEMEKEKYLAVILCGHEDDWRGSTFGLSSAAAYDAFTCIGYSSDQIYYLAAMTESRVDGENTYDNRDWVFNELCARSDENTQIFIYACGHGDGDRMYFGTFQGDLYADILDSRLSAINYKHCTMLFYCCYSGEFGLKLSKFNRLIYTTTADRIDNNLNTFMYGFFDALALGYNYGIAWMAGDTAVAFTPGLCFWHNPQIDDNGDGVSYGNAGAGLLGVDILPDIISGEGALSLNVWPSDKHTIAISVLPSVNTLPASIVDINNVKINGELTDLGTSNICEVWFEYGLTTGYGSSTISINKYFKGQFSAVINELESGTTYHYRAVAKNTIGTIYGEDKTFTTLTSAATTIQGHVYNNQENPINNAHIAITSQDETQTYNQYTDNNGYYNTEVIPNTYYITVTKTNYDPIEQSGPYTISNGQILTIDFSMNASANLFGYVNDTNGNLIGGAKIQLNNGQNTYTYTLGNMLGFYAFNWKLTPGTYDITANKTGYLSDTKYNFVISQGANELDFTLQKIITKPTVTTLTVGAVGTNGATVRGELTDLGGANNCNVWFEYGTNSYYGSSTTSVSISTTGEFNSNINGLLDGTTYHYRAVANNPAGTTYGTDKTFTTLNSYSQQIPTICCLETTNIGTTSVTLTATLTDDGGEPCNLRFYIKQGTTTIADWTKTGTYNSPYTYTNTFTELSPSSFYVAYTQVSNSAGGRITMKRFTTPASQNLAPSVTTLTVDAVGTNGATVHGELTNLGSLNSCNVWFEYGKTTTYGSTTASTTMSSTGEFSASISGVDSNTLYHYRAVANNPAGTTYGTDKTFTTLNSYSQQIPTICCLETTNIGTTSVTLTATLTDDGGEPCNLRFYIKQGTTTIADWTKTGTYNSPYTYTNTFSGLTTSTSYVAYATVSNSAGGKTITKSFTTGSSPVVITPSVSTLEETSVASYSANLNGNLVNMGGTSSCTAWFVYDTSYHSNWQDYAYSTSTITKTTTGTFTKTVSSLQPSTTYHFRAVASNSVGNAKGDDNTFTTSTCFLAGTKITMADNTYKNIEDVQVGELIKSFDEEKQIVTIGTVLNVFHHTSPEQMTNSYLIINNLLKVTDNHPIFVNNNWIDADEIKIGDKLRDINDMEITVKSIEKIRETVPTYNLEVEKYHTYYAENILVHNKATPGWVRPDAAQDTTGWQNEDNARDTSTSTYSHYYSVGDTGTTNYALTLTYNSALSCNQIKIDASKITQLTGMTVKLYYGSTLKQTCSFTTWTDHSYTYKSFTTTQINKVEITFTLGSGFGYGVYQPKVYDFQVYRV
jgi:PKD repeat protein